MPSLDIFNDDAFSLTGLTSAMEVAPYKPRLLGSLGLFTDKPIRTTTAFIEKRNGRLHLISTAARGTMKDVRSSDKRKLIPVNVPHIPYFETVLSGDVQNVRAFGSETELQAVASVVNDQLVKMREDHEVTEEFHRVGALKGSVLDADGTTELTNMFDLFGLTQQTENFASSAASFATICTAIIRKVANALGNETTSGIVAICGDDYFDGIISHTSMQAAYDRWRDGEWKRMSMLGPQWYGPAANGFGFQNILFINYRGQIDDVSFVAADEAYYVPLGVPDMFQTVIAPADFMETVNTLGKKFYARQEPLPFNKGIQLHTQSNILTLCTRPDAVVKSTYSSSSSA